MTANDKVHVSEQEALAVAEASRQKKWRQPSFLKELFLGNFRLDLIHPYPIREEPREEFARFYERFVRLLDSVDSAEIDRTGEYPQHLVDGLREIGAFGMKIPKEYGGLGFTNSEYQEIMECVGGSTATSRRCCRRISRSVCRTRSSSSAATRSKTSTCRAAPPARSRPSP